MKKKDEDHRINERVEYLMNLENLNPNSFSQKLGYKNNGLIYDIIKGKAVEGSNERKRTRPGRKLLERISKVFGVRYEWLIEGELPIYEAQLKKSDIKLIELPYIEFYAAASFQEESGNGLEYVAKKTKKIIRLHEEEYYRNTYLISVSGDSMSPTIADDALLLARVVEKEDWKYIGNAVYAIFYRNSYEVKRVVKNELLEKGYLTLIADNPKYGEKKILAEDIHQILKIEEIVQSKVY
ncbi:S24 family peptidase [Raineya sp.]